MAASAIAAATARAGASQLEYMASLREDLRRMIESCGYTRSAFKSLPPPEAMDRLETFERHLTKFYDAYMAAAERVSSYEGNYSRPCSFPIEADYRATLRALRIHKAGVAELAARFTPRDALAHSAAELERYCAACNSDSPVVGTDTLTRLQRLRIIQHSLTVHISAFQNALHAAGGGDANSAASRELLESYSDLVHRYSNFSKRLSNDLIDERQRIAAARLDKRNAAAAAAPAAGKKKASKKFTPAVYGARKTRRA